MVKDGSGRFLHALKSSPNDSNLGRSAVLNVDIERRKAIQRHHTATHVLHWALRNVLGDHIRQAGSLVEPDRLRFDFSHFEGIKPEQIEEIERISNEKLLLNDNLESYEVPFSKNPKKSSHSLMKNTAIRFGWLTLADGARNFAVEPMFHQRVKLVRFASPANPLFLPVPVGSKR